MQVARIPTFQVIILQGILGSTPWNALVFMTRYLQLIGFSNLSASLALSAFQAGAALGGVVGGVIGDWAAKRNANHGRIFACQFSVSMGIPFSLLVIKGLPLNGEVATVAVYCAVLFVFGLMHVWAAPACNNPVFAEIVPPELRNLVYAFDRCGVYAPLCCGPGALRCPYHASCWLVAHASPLTYLRVNFKVPWGGRHACVRLYP